jgi:hypothetical protein
MSVPQLAESNTHDPNAMLCNGKKDRLSSEFTMLVEKIHQVEAKARQLSADVSRWIWQTYPVLDEPL